LLRTCSGSIATIVRIPYLKQLSQSDFLYSTTDVAIWSTVEPGIGITASAIATLKPLFRTFLSRSRLFGSSKSGDKTSTSPLPRKNNSEFHLRRVDGNKFGQEELGLGYDIGRRVGNTTTIESISSWNGGQGQSRPMRVASGQTQQGLNGLESESPSGDNSSEEFLPVQKPSGDWAMKESK
jgi:hypothetical protein